MTSCMATWVAMFYSVVLVMTCSMEDTDSLMRHGSTVETEMMKSLPATMVINKKFLAAMVMT